MNLQALKNYTTKEGDGDGYGGWDGNHACSLYGKELTKAIREALQSVLCSGANPLKKSDILVSRGRGGYTPSLYVKIRANGTGILASESRMIENIKEQVRHGKMYWVGDRMNISRDKYMMESQEEREKIESATAQTLLDEIKRYQERKTSKTINKYYVDESWELSEFGKEVFKACAQVVSAFNYDHSDMMTDYFSRGIYDNYEIAF